MRSFLMLVCLFLSWAVEPVAAGTEPVCGDFLAMAGKKTIHLEFMGCEPDKNAQLRVLRALYRVPGRDAIEVEKYLVAETGMKPLSFICCFWEPIPGEGGRYGYLPHDQWPGSEDAILNQYEVSMASEETLHNTRAKWPQISWFHVSVTLFLETP